MGAPSSRLAGIDLWRVIAIVAVIVIHVRPLEGMPTYAGGPSVADVLDICSRFAVPYFFMVTGYFFALSCGRGAAPGALFWRRLPRLIMLVVIWSAFYAVFRATWITSVAESGPKAFYWNVLEWLKGFREHPVMVMLFLGGRYHLWFLLSMIWALALLSGLLQLRLRVAIVPVAVMLFVVGLALGSYRAVLFSSEPPLGITFDPRNGPLLSFPFVVAGWWLAQRSLPAMKWGLLLAIVGMAGQLGESMLWHHVARANLVADYWISTLPLGVGVFIIAAAMQLDDRWNWLCACGRYTLGVYVLHPAVIDAFDAIFKDWRRGLWGVVGVVGVYLVSLGLTWAWSWMIEAIRKAVALRRKVGLRLP